MAVGFDGVVLGSSRCRGELRVSPQRRADSVGVMPSTVSGGAIAFAHPSAARRAGISIIHQELSLYGAVIETVQGFLARVSVSGMVDRGGWVRSS